MGVKIFSEKYLEQNGIDAHKVKDDYNALPNSRYDIYYDDTVTIRDKKGKLFADTGLTKQEFFEIYGGELSSRR